MKRVLSILCLGILSSGTMAGDEKKDKVIEGNNVFALDAWKKLPSKGNLFWSPFNFRMALTVCYYGAAGETAKELREALSISEGQSALDYAKLAIKAVSAKDDSVKVANGFWIEDSVKVSDFYSGFLSALGTKCESVKFSERPEETRLEINKWVEEKTAEKVKELIKQGTIKTDTRAVVASAIHFKADWHVQFPEKETDKGAFSVDTLKVKVVPFMKLEEMSFPYSETDLAQVLELPYKGKELSMIVFLPKKGDGLPAVESALSPKSFETQKSEKKVRVILPKWKTSMELKGGDLLTALGVTHAFTPQADFSGAFGKNSGIFISDVIHKAYVDVNEKGTEAAAATGVVMRTTSVGQAPTVFKADRPFVYVIRHNATGAILFMGRVTDPS